MQDGKDTFICAEVIKFEKPGIPLNKKHRRNRSKKISNVSEDITEIDSVNNLDDVTAVDCSDDVTAVDEEVTEIDSVYNNEDVTMVDD